jgi:Bacterial Ig domain
MLFMTRPTIPFTRPGKWLALLAVLGLGACGGGFYLGYEYGFDDTPPSVSLAVASTSVRAGDVLQVSAAAADDYGIDSVAFYRLDGNGAVLLGSDGREPYNWQVTVPSDGRTVLTLFARATDWDGNRTDSVAVSVNVLP